MLLGKTNLILPARKLLKPQDSSPVPSSFTGYVGNTGWHSYAWRKASAAYTPASRNPSTTSHPLTQSAAECIKGPQGIIMPGPGTWEQPRALGDGTYLLRIPLQPWVHLVDRKRVIQEPELEPSSTSPTCALLQKSRRVARSPPGP